MSRINVLSKHISELIAAGEVIERPASVVKELVENSMDANSTEITIEIENGGNTFIRITDNGCGIDIDDLPKAFLRHATSKICNENDLDSINTFGFRGEALASITAISHVLILTRTSDKDFGYSISATEDEISVPEKCGCPFGTTVIVRDLFYNTPARQKFLKKDSTEGNAISTLIDKLALSHPEIKFRFIKDGEIKLNTFGDSNLKSVVAQIYGKEFSNDLYDVNYENLNNSAYSVSGLISKPTSLKASRTYQNVFVNGRYIKSNTIVAALEEAYKGSAMVGKFPSCVLFITIPFGCVDVNVHPSKVEVRFQNEKDIFDLVYYGVKNSLHQFDNKPLIVTNDKVISKPEIKTILNQPTKEKNEVFIQTSISEYKNIINSENKKDNDFYNLYKSPSEKKINNISVSNISVQENNKPLIDSIKPVKPVVSETVSINIDENYKYIGEIFKTYIILENYDDIILIDKHAAHERILFNKLISNEIAFDCQELIIPINCLFTHDEYDTIVNNKDLYLKFGFELDDFGDNTIIIRAIPFWISEKESQLVISEIAQSIMLSLHDKTPEKLYNLYANISCRAAIKAHDNNSKDELEIIVKTINNNTDIKYCPHGRPIYTRIPKTKIEHLFGRI